MLRLLLVVAHPDDEAQFGGSLLLASERGVETFVVCLTPGQAGSHRGGARDDDELSAMRRKEFEASMKHLGVTDWLVLDYPDGKLDRLNFHEITGELTRIVRKTRPDIVLTFGPEGSVTAHPDHAMVSLFTTAAYQEAPRANRFSSQLNDGLKPHHPQKLYYQTSEITMDGRPPVSLPPATTTIEIGKYLDTKIEAFKKHASQAPLFELFETHMKKLGPKEHYHLAATNRPSSIKTETDLWDGVVESK